MDVFEKIEGWFGGSAKIRDVLVLDIGSSVKAMHVQVPHEGHERALIRALGEAPMRSLEKLADVQVLLEAIKTACRNMRPSGIRLPRKTVVFLNGSVLKARHFIVTRERIGAQAQQRIDVAEFKNMLERAEWQALEAIRHQAQVKSGTALMIVDGSVTRFLVDGYQVDVLAGLKGRTITIGLMNYFLTRTQHEALTAMARGIGTELVGIVSSTQAQVTAQLQAMGGRGEFMMVDIGDMSTDVSLVQGGQLQGIESFDLGASIFKDAIQSEFGASATQASETEARYQAGTLDAGMVRKLERRLKEDAEVLRNGVLLALGKFKHLKPLPNLLVLTGGGARFGLVKKYFSKTGWYSQLPLRGRLRVKVLVAPDLQYVGDVMDKLVGPETIPMLAAAYHVACCFGKKTEVNRMLGRVIKLLNTR